MMASTDSNASAHESELEHFVTVEQLSQGPCSSKTAHVKVSSPDQVGLGCDLARVLFDFGLLVDSGDFSTDGTWVHLLFVVRAKQAHQPPWPLLRQRLEAVCPPARALKPRAARAPQVQFVLRVDARDRLSLLHDVTAALWERELTVHRAVVTTSPSDRAVDLFYVSDNRRELPNTPRQSEVCEHVSSALNEPASSCQFTAAPVLASLSSSSLDDDDSTSAANNDAPPDEHINEDTAHHQPSVSSSTPSSPKQGYPPDQANTDSSGPDSPLQQQQHHHPNGSTESPPSGDGTHSAFNSDLQHNYTHESKRSTPNGTSASNEAGRSNSPPEQTFPPSACVTGAEVAVDRLTSRAHTVLHVRVPDRQGLFYDCMRCMKDLGVSVSYGRVLLPSTGLCAANDGSRRYANCEIVLFLPRMQQHEETAVCEALQRAVERPFSVSIANVGCDGQNTQLAVRATLDAAGSARPRVLLDVTGALRKLSIWVFKADIKASGPEHGAEREEVHTFLLTDHRGQAIEDCLLREKICSCVERALLGEVRFQQ
jgi:UTP:GlnB (protein PII) uridylyltransferase